jgi:hypothetical protein
MLPLKSQSEQQSGVRRPEPWLHRMQRYLNMHGEFLGCPCGALRFKMGQ